MKVYCKMLLGVAGFGLIATSCSQDEVVSTNRGEGIVFHSDVSSRAAETTTANLEEIWVYADAADGVNVIPGEVFTNNGGAFEAEDSYYWPDGDKEVSFLSLAPIPKKLGVKLNQAPEGEAPDDLENIEDLPDEYLNNLIIKDGKAILKNYRVGRNADWQHDLVLATTTGKKSTHGVNGVSLNFKHLLSQVDIRAKYEGEYTVEIDSVCINKVRNTATCDLSGATPVWSDHKFVKRKFASPAVSGPKAENKVIGETAVSLVDGIDGGNFMLIPQTYDVWDRENDLTNEKNGAYLVFYMTIKKDGNVVYPTPALWTAAQKSVRVHTSTGNGKIAVPLPVVDWKPGKRYVYTIDFSNGFGYFSPLDPTNPGEPILGGKINIVKVEVSDWVDGTTHDVTPTDR